MNHNFNLKLFLKRIDKLLGCKTDCDFSYILQVPSSFNSMGTECGVGSYNDTAFANNVVSYLPSDVASTCIYTLCSLINSASSYADPDAASLLSDSSKFL